MKNRKLICPDCKILQKPDEYNLFDSKNKIKSFKKHSDDITAYDQNKSCFLDPSSISYKENFMTSVDSGWQVGDKHIYRHKDPQSYNPREPELTSRAVSAVRVNSGQNHHAFGDKFVFYKSDKCSICGRNIPQEWIDTT